MDITLTPNLALVISFIAFLAACGIWLLVRIRRQTVWLPPLKRIDMEPSRLRRLIPKTPPWIPFFFFVMTVLTFLFFVLQPANKVLSQQAPQSDRVHLFIDLSPSLSRYVTLPQLVSQVAHVWEEWGTTVKLSLSTSHSEEVFFPKSKEELEGIINALGFHRAGIELGSALEKVKSHLAGVSVLLILSDGDQSSWQNFTWKHLKDGFEVFLVDVKTPQLFLDNVYFRDVILSSQPQDPILEWEVEIERRGTPLPRGGILRATLQGRTLAEAGWNLNEGLSRLMIPVSVPIEKIESFNLPSDAPLVWQLELIQPDLMALDNTFHTSIAGLRQNVLLVAPPAGERMIEDPFYQLQSALEVTGFLPRRWDRWDEHGSEASKFWIFGIDEDRPFEETCPLSLGKRRMDFQRTGRTGTELPHVWLAPLAAETTFKTLCHCFYNLIEAEKLDLSIPQVCRDVYDRTSFNELMRAWGASRLGGSVAEETQSLSWFKEDKALGFSLTAFTVPLKPSKQSGLNHALFPLLIRDLVKWYGVRDLVEKDGTGAWPRPRNLAQLEGWDQGRFDPHVKLSNVPVGESLLVDLPLSSLPKRWEGGDGTGQQNVGLQIEKNDPLPWLYICLTVILSLMLLELMWNIGARLRQNMSLLILVGFLGPLLGSPKVHAELYVSILAKQVQPFSLDRVAREISSRTSIDEFSGEVFVETNGQKLKGEPWYWMKSSEKSLIVDKHGALNPEIRSWLARGGFLVLQGFRRDELSQLSSKGFSSQRDQALWVPIPPDHEIMRSFYLLEALPSCRGEVWYGLVFDGRLAILAIPYNFLESLASSSVQDSSCEQAAPWEQRVRIFINIVQVALTTDYKKDQVHMREILKRLR